jgi:VCBS repeat-containing protein
MKNDRGGLTAILSITLTLTTLTFSLFFSKAGSVDVKRTAQKAKGEEKVTLHAEGRGRPWINLRDGVEFPTVYTGPVGLEQVLERGLARPVALATGHFHENGPLDLIVGYVGPSSGILALHQRNVDSISAKNRDERIQKAKGELLAPPFLLPAQVFEVPEPPDFIVPGDFDVDVRYDVVMAARGSDALYFLRGDGRGGLGEAKRIQLPGKVTALLGGEINRVDGLIDLVAGIVGPDGPQVLVFEGPRGALRSEPEIFELPSEATALALGQLDEDSPIDLAVAAGSELLIVHGRDRGLWLPVKPVTPPPVNKERVSFPFTIASMVAGDFVWEGDQREEVALLTADGTVRVVGQEKTETTKQKASGIEAWHTEPLASGSWPSASRLIRAHLSTLPGDDLVLVDSANHQLHPLINNGTKQATRTTVDKPRPSFLSPAILDVEGEPLTVLPMRLNDDLLDDLVILKDGPSGVAMVLSTVAATFTVTNLNDSGAGSLRTAIASANANPGPDTITFAVAGTINILSQLPALSDSSGGTTIDGTTAPGYAAAPVVVLNGSGTASFVSGLQITSANNTVRALQISSFGGWGIDICCTNASGNVGVGNYIGTDGTVALGNRVFGNNNRIGTDGDGMNDLAERNIISGNVGDGISIGGNGHTVAGNYIGTDVTGATALRNGGGGIFLGGANHRIGTNGDGVSDVAECNVISGNGSNGVTLGGDGGHILSGNYIGINAAGTAALGNANIGVEVGSNNNVRIGTNGNGVADTNERNIISGNRHQGVLIAGSSHIVAGNYIGTDVTGTIALGNDVGVWVANPAPNTRIGTDGNGIADEAERNVIGGNRIGMLLNNHSNDQGTIVAGNYIGADFTGARILGNTLKGIAISGGKKNLIGGTSAASGNVISGNGSDGVEISRSFSTGNLVQGNFIGTDVTGTADLGNGGHGIVIADSASNNTIGGAADGGANTIAFNDGDGVFVIISTNNAIKSNSIFSNAGIGINLCRTVPCDGVTSNDPGDSDTGANNLQNFPVLTSASSSGGSTTIQGTLNSTANTTFSLEFFSNAACDPSGNGEGETFIGSTTVITDGSGNTSFNVTFPITLPSGRLITATATDSNSNTSEFSKCVAVRPPNEAPVAANDSYSVNEDITLTVAAPGVLGNDIDADGNPLTAILVSTTSKGTLTFNSNGSFSYTPNANFNGTDSFTYKANDGTVDSNIATVTITVNPVNDAPTAVADNKSTNEDTPLTFPVSDLTANDSPGPSDESGQTLTVTAVTATANTHGSVSLAAGNVTYTPAANFNGAASFNYTVCDNGSPVLCATGTVNVTVVAVNDAPVAVNDSYSTNEDITLTVAAPGVLGNDTDVDGNALTAVLVSGPTKGTLTLNNNGSFSYTPNANFNGADSFTYKANDGTADSNVATVTITVNAVNDAPVAVNDSYSTNEDTTLSVAAPGVLGNDTDVDGNTLTAVLVSGPTEGTLTLNSNGSFSYTPNANFNGTDSFTYKANDGTVNSNIATVTITVNAVNDAPVAVNDSYSTNEDTTLTVAAPGVLGNDTDVDGNALTAVLVSGPTKGMLTLNSNGSFSYTPNANFNGTDSFTYKANDGIVDSNVATVIITVNSVNDGPDAVDDTATTTQGVSIDIPVLGNDTDVDGDTLTVTSVTQGAGGTVTINLNGTVRYTPNGNFTGTDSFTYTITDGKGGTDTARVTVTITPLACSTTVTVEANFVRKSSATAAKVPVQNAKVVMLPKARVQAVCSNLLDANCVWANLAAINTAGDPVVMTDVNGRATPTSSVADPNGWAIYLDVTSATAVGAGAPAITLGTTQMAVANTECAPQKQFTIILVTDGTATTAMTQRQQRITGSVLDITYPEEVEWDGTEFLYPFIFTSDSDWEVDVCANVPEGYRVVGNPCVQLFVMNETKVIFFDVQEIGSPEPHLAVRGHVKHKGRTQPLNLDVKGKRKKRR